MIGLAPALLLAATIPDDAPVHVAFGGGAGDEIGMDTSRSAWPAASGRTTGQGNYDCWRHSIFADLDLAPGVQF